MSSGHTPIQYLLTLPPRMAEAFEVLENRRRPEWFSAADPEGRPLGSGGGTANLLARAWGATAAGSSFSSWLRSSRKLVLHGGGQSRRLPAYGAVGKLLMPLPVFRWSRGQRLDQTLLDLQLPDYERVLKHAGDQTVAMITSGDVLLRFGPDLPPFPNVDVLGLGMWLAPEKASRFGVFCCSRRNPNELVCFLQKPSPEEIMALSGQHLCMVDTGMWLLSERAIRILMDRSGWTSNDAGFRSDEPKCYELYSDFGLGLGSTPTKQDPAINALTCAAVPLPEARFFHFGTCEEMIDSVAELQTLVVDGTKLSYSGARERPDQVTQNSRFEAGLTRGGNEQLWVENSVVPRGWEIASRHVFTGIPENSWSIRLEQGRCLDMVPIGDSDYAVRPYGFRDTFSGPIGQTSTLWLGRPAPEWFVARGVNPAAAGLDTATDIQESRIFAVLASDKLEEGFMQWLLDESPADNAAYRELWLSAERLSAREMASRINLHRLYAQRQALRAKCFVPMWENFRSSVFFRLDLESTGKSFAQTGSASPNIQFVERDDPMHKVHDRMFRSAVHRHRSEPTWTDLEMEAFAELRRAIVREAQLAPASPHRSIQEDQIVWARSPVRLDLAGGWTDTPPYCLENGGSVLNLAVDLNGQPPIQVFARLSEKPELVIRSIDLGLEERVRTYAELENFDQPGSPFALPKAALALAGFLPRFHAANGRASLKDQLTDFGGGIELSLLSAVPKGSGLGTSSILAATVLGALGDLCGLGWDRNVLFTRTLALEQMLTTGGGWQDQAGAIFRGIKLIETSAGLTQKPTLRWLPNHLLDRDYANRTVLLYYTGITRLAKNILAEIVRGLFLNSPTHLVLIRQIGRNAFFAAEAIQKCDFDLLAEAVRNSWSLNKQLDSGTNPPEVQSILARVTDKLAAAKLLGAGGGGYLLMLAKDEAAANRVRSELEARPPNSRARFVNFAISETGLQITRS